MEDDYINQFLNIEISPSKNYKNMRQEREFHKIIENIGYVEWLLDEDLDN